MLHTFHMRNANMQADIKPQEIVGNQVSRRILTSKPYHTTPETQPCALPPNHLFANGEI
jgi:hypothetical protein